MRLEAGRPIGDLHNSGSFAAGVWTYNTNQARTMSQKTSVTLHSKTYDKVRVRVRAQVYIGDASLLHQLKDKHQRYSDLACIYYEPPAI